MATLPEGVGLDVELSVVEQPTNTFLIDWNSKQIAGLDDGLEAMHGRLWISYYRMSVSGGRFMTVTSEQSWKIFLAKNTHT